MTLTDTTTVAEAQPRFAGAPAADSPFDKTASTPRLDSLSEGETLALLVRRSGVADPAALSEALLARFGCMARVLGATFAELLQVAPLEAALDLQLLQEATRRVLEFPILRRPLLSSSSSVEAYLRHRLAGLAREQFRVLFLDRANQLIGDELMGEGTVDHAPVYPREVVRRALELNASACCLAHNHPTGNPAPSQADIAVTRQIVEAARALNIAVHDHFLVAGEVVVSFRAQGLI
jgi:DNA repair protein RadC